MRFSALSGVLVFAALFAGCSSDPDPSPLDVGGGSVLDAPDIDTAAGAPDVDVASDVDTDASSDTPTDLPTDSEPDSVTVLDIVAETPELGGVVGESVEIRFLVTDDERRVPDVEVHVDVDGGEVVESPVVTGPAGFAVATVALGELVGLTTVSARVGESTATVEIRRSPAELAAFDGDDGELVVGAVNARSGVIVDRFGNPIPGVDAEVALDESAVTGTLDSGATVAVYEADAEGRVEFTVSLAGVADSFSVGERVAFGTIRQLDRGGSVALEARLAVDELVLTSDLPPHLVVRPGTEFEFVGRATTPAGVPVAGLELRAVAGSDTWTTTSGVTDADGEALLRIRAPDDFGDETAVTVESAERSAGVALALAEGPRFASEGRHTSLLLPSTFADVATIDSGASLGVVHGVTFSDGFERHDFYQYEPADDAWTHLLPRRPLSNSVAHDSFDGGRYHLASALTEVGARDDVPFAALVDTDTGNEYVLATDGAVLVSHRYEPLSGHLHYAVAPAAEDEPFEIWEVELSTDEFSPELRVTADAEPTLSVGECDGVLFWQNRRDNAYFRNSGSLEHMFAGTGPDRVKIDVVYAETGACAAFLHDYDDDDSFWLMRPAGGSYRLVPLMEGHDADLLIPSHDLSFIVADSWTDHIIRILHLGEVPELVELTGPHPHLDGLHPTALAVDETFLLAERHYENGIEELFYMPTDGSGPDLPLRISPEVPEGVPGWPLRRWIASPNFDEVVLLHPLAFADGARILTAFTVDLSDPEAGATQLDPATGPDPYEPNESLEDCGYDETGRWGYMVGDPDTLDEHNFYVWRRDTREFRTLWTAEVERLTAEFLSGGDYALLRSDLGIHLVDVTAAMSD